MLPKLGVLIALSLSPIVALAQSAQQEVRTETELAYALCRVSLDARSTEYLLSAHQQLVNDRLWTYLNSLASAAYFNRLPRQSLEAYEAAILVAGRLQDSKLLAKSHYNIGITYSGLNEFSKAIVSYEKSRAYFEQAGLQRDLIYVFGDLGALHFILEDYIKARDYSERAVTLADRLRTGAAPPGARPDEFGKARALHTLGEINLRDGDHSRAIEELQMSLALYQQLNGKGRSYNAYIAGVYAALGKVYPEAGDYALGLSYLNKALDIVRNQPDPTMQASLLNSIGYLYMEQEDYAQSKAQFDYSLRLYRSVNNQREEARVLLNLGVIEQRQGNYDGALQHFRISLQAAKATRSVDVQIAAAEGIGVVLTAKKDLTGALEALNESLAIAKDTRNKTRQVELLWRTAQTYYELENYSQSAALAENALALARASHLPKLTYLATTTLGQSYAAQKKLDIATQTLKQAVDQLEAMRDRVAGGEVESQLFLENKVTSYHSLVDLFIKQDKLLDALLLAERAKGRVLLDVMSGGRSDVAKVLTPTEKQEGQRLNRKISEINDLIRAQHSADSSALNSLYRQLDAARLQYQSFQDALYVAHPNLKARSGRTASLTEADVTRLTLKGDAAYLEYVTSKEAVYLFVLTPKTANVGTELKVYPIAIKPEDLARKVDQFHQRLADRHPDFASIARELYVTLIGPAEQQLQGINTICIVPDGFLWNLPFQALMTGSNHYLIEDHALYYAPSLSVLREMSKDKTSQPTKNASLIAFGNPVIGKDEQRNEELCPLPEAETEVTSVAKTFGSAGDKVFIGRAASEQTFKALAPEFATIHLATHGVLDNRQPLYSHLLLTKTVGDPENDGLLEAREIMNMNLHADLAVLSACETANGRIAPGEGVMGMSWAFFVAGTRSMLVSQWKVNSASTSELMVSFYHALESNQSQRNGKKATALRQAALHLMNDQRYRHPFYWASFVLVGGNN
ncbi:CHAT domain-containing protein [soil metagenome]